MEKNPCLKDLSDYYRISRGEEGSKFAISANPGGQFLMMLPKDIERYVVMEGIPIAQSILTATKLEALYSHPKVWIIRIQKMRWRQRIVCAFDARTNSAGMKTLQIVVSPSNDVELLKYLSALLSSRIVNFWCINYLADDMNQSYLERVPITGITDSPSDILAKRSDVVQLTDSMLALHKQLSGAKSEQEKVVIQRQVEATDAEIDKLVYDLYGLTEEEIAIVENTAR